VGHVQHADLAQRDRARADEVDHPLRDLRVELRARRLLELGERLLDLHAAAVEARRGHGLEGVRDAEHAAGERDVLAGELLGIAAAVPALVQVEHPVGDLRHARALDDVAAERGVALHLEELVVGEPGGLEQHRVGHADLADVVEDPGGPDLVDLLLRHPELAREHRGVLGDPGGVLVGVAVLEVDRAGEGVDRVGEAGGARAIRLLLERERRVDEGGVHDAAVAAGALGAVQRALGEPHQAVLVAGVAGELGDAGAEREPGRSFGERRGADRVAQALDHALRAPGVGVGEGEQELVAADAAVDVAGAELAGDQA